MKLLKLLSIALLIVSCQEKEAPLAEGHYRINGMVSGMENGNLYLMTYTDPGSFHTDTLTVLEGKFTIENPMEGILLNGSLAGTTEMRDQNRGTLFLEPAIMELTVDVTDLSKVKLSGSKTQDDLDRLTQLSEEVTVKYKKEMDAFKANRALYDSAKDEAEKKELKWKDDELRGALEPYYAETAEVAKQFIKDNPTSYISLQKFMSLTRDMTQEEARATFNKFPEDLKKTSMGERIAKDIEDMSKGIPGAIAGNFNTTDINGKPIKLDDFKGQYLLVDFWASWCVPCRKGNPHLLSLYAKYKSKGFEILGVSDDDRDHDAWRKAVKDDEIGVWRHVLRGMKVDMSGGGFKLLDDGISGGYNISSLPTKILIGPDGVIVGRYGGGGGTDEDMDRDLAAIFEK